MHRQLRQASGVSLRDGPFAADREVNPTAACRTLTRETGIAPPGPHEGIVNGLAVFFEPEINALQVTPAPWMRTLGIRVDHMLRHFSVLPPPWR